MLSVSRDGEHGQADVLNLTGFSAQGDRRIVIGLAGNQAAVQTGMRWADGTAQDLGCLETGKYHRIRKAVVSSLPIAGDAR